MHILESLKELFVFSESFSYYLFPLQTVFSGFTGEIWSTYSFISGRIFGTILGADMENYTMNVSPAEAGFGREVRKVRVC